MVDGYVHIYIQKKAYCNFKAYYISDTANWHGERYRFYLFSIEGSVTGFRISLVSKIYN